MLPSHYKPVTKIVTTILVVVAVFLFSQNEARAAITATQVSAVGATAAATTRTVTAFTPAANTLYLLWTTQTFAGTPAIPTVSCANGLTMAQVNTVTFGTIAAPNYRITLFRGMIPSAGTNNTCTITWNQTTTGDGYSLVSFSGTDTSGTNGSGAVVQSVTGALDSAATTGLSITLATIISGSTTAGGFANARNTANSLSAGTGYTAGTSWNFNTPATSARAEWNTTGSATVNMTQSNANVHIGGIAVEIRQPAAATLSASPTTCTISSGASTCTVPFTWSISNAISPNLYNSTTATQYTTATSGTGVSFSITNGSNTVQARDSSTVLASTSVTASCTSGTTWNGSICVTPDTSAPTPNPMTFASAPSNDSAVQISMTSTTGSDATPPVNYLFTNDNSACGATAGTGGTTSSWQASTSYSDSGLQANKCYGYTVTARDSVTPTPNTGTASSISSTYTSANTPGTPTLSGPTATTLNITNAENGNPASNPATFFAVQVVTTSPSDATWLNQWVNASGLPSTTAVWLTDAQLDALVLNSLQNNTTYGVKVKARNQNNIETPLSAEGQGTTSSAPVTTIADGTTPTSTVVAPESGIIDLDYFTLTTNTGSDTVTAATVTLGPTNAFNNIAQVDLTDNSNVARCTAVVPSSNTINFTSCSSNGGVTVGTSATTYKIRITPKTHALMPAPSAGASYATTGTVTSFTSTNTHSGSDASSATITIDNLSPSPTTAASASAGDAQVTVSWTNPGDADFSNLVVLRDTATIGSGSTPAEGSSPSVGSSCGGTACQVRYISNGTSFVDGSLSNGTTYFYRIFAKDIHGNYTAYTSTQEVSDTPSATTFTITSSTGANGNISPLGATSVAQGGSQTYTLTPDLGYMVSTLTIDGSTNATTTTSYTFNNVQATHTISVTFTLAPVTHTITSSAGTGGTISPLGATTVADNASQTFTITPDSGYNIETLTVDGGLTATSTSYTFSTVTANHTISATFSLIPPPPGSFSIVATSGANGTVTPAGATSVTQGSSQTYTITPNSGYYIATLLIDGTSIATSTSYTFTNVQAAHTISATFTALSVAATTTPAPGVSRPTTITFFGKAFAKGSVSISNKFLSKDTLAEQEVTPGDDGSFRISFVGILQGLQSFGLIAKDKDGHASQTKFFSIDTSSDDFLEKEIIIPPTTVILAGQVTRGANVSIVGYASPMNSVRVYIDDILIKEVSAGSDGSYSLTTGTGALTFGQHNIKVKQIDTTSGKESDFSTTRTFIVSQLTVVKADFNGDGKIDVQDWSIFLSRWLSKNPLERSSIDLTGDGKVDISDFSIFIRAVRRTK